jgi:hypothetical protein
MNQQQRDKAKSAVVTVGDGRGFVVQYGHDRLVATAACRASRHTLRLHRGQREKYGGKHPIYR